MINRKGFPTSTCGGKIFHWPIVASRNSLLFRLKSRLKSKSWRGSTVSHADDPFSVARSNARWVFLGAFSLIRSALCSSSFGLSLLTSCCASFVRESSGNWCDWDTICSTRGFVTLTDEAYSRLAIIIIIIIIIETLEKKTCPAYL